MSVDLWVTRGNDPAQGFYRAMGFRGTGDYLPLPSDPCKNELRQRPQSWPADEYHDVEPVEVRRVASSTASWIVTSTPSGVRAGRGRASLTTTVHESSSSPAISSAE
jgi:hypothetical protein